MKRYLLFDLDGTLTDPKVGICTCVQYALASFGIEEPDLDKLEPFIGPPLKDSFRDFYRMDDEQVEAAVKKYRERFRDTGIFENKIYDGIPELLQTLYDKGMFLAVASSKPTVFVERILEHFHIRKYFQVVVGSELDGVRDRKEEVVEEALRQLFEGGPVEKEQIYMIGDRRYDVEGAKAAGIESVGVAYGYGGIEELREAKADYIVRSVEELQRFLLRGTEDEEQGGGLRKAGRLTGQMVLPALGFFFARAAAVYLVRLLCDEIGKSLAGIPIFLYNEEGVPVSYTGNAVAVMQIAGFAAGGAFIWRAAMRQIRKTAEETKLLHLRKEPKKSYVLMGAAGLAIMFGLNLLLYLSGAMEASSAYREAAAGQYAMVLPLGLLLYVAVAPMAEELLFRGLIYNCVRRMFRPMGAMGVAAAFFGIYHGNSVQGIYGFLMGCLIIYAYEYFGDFRAAVAMHAGVNLASYLLGNTLLVKSGFVCWPVCAAFLAAGGVCLFLLHRRKRRRTGSSRFLEEKNGRAFFWQKK